MAVSAGDPVSSQFLGLSLNENNFEFLMPPLLLPIIIGRKAL